MVSAETPGSGKGTVAGTKHKKQQDDAFCVLADDALLTLIFEFVGLYEYRFVAILNKRFRKLYSEFQKKKESSKHPRSHITAPLVVLFHNA